MLRALPGLLRHPLRTRRPHRGLTLRAFTEAGFGILEETKEREIVLCVTGTFWRPTGLDRPVAPGVARAVWNFALRDGGDGRTVPSTETRVVCGDPASRRKFLRYWRVVGPFSGVIRRSMLRAVRREAERTG